MSKKDEPVDPGRRRFLNEFFTRLGREAGKAYRELRKATEELEELSHEVEGMREPEPPPLQPEAESRDEADLDAVKEQLVAIETKLVQLEEEVQGLAQESSAEETNRALLQQIVEHMATLQARLAQEPEALQADTPEAQEVNERWQAARKRLWDLVKLIMVGFGWRMFDALFEAVVSDDVYPWVKQQWQRLFARAQAEGIIEESPLPTATAESPPPEIPAPKRETPTPRRRRGVLVPELVPVPPGYFWMGSDKRYDRMAWDDELPQHRLHLPAYRIGKYPVTNAEYADFVRATGHQAPEYWKDGVPPRDKLEHPVVYVTWRDAQAYCLWLRERTGIPFRLPSEAEWEKAARGADGRIWPWGNSPPDATRCNFDGNVGGTTRVGSYPKGVSPYSCYDMAGNVWEWTRSLYRDYPYRADDGREDEEGGGSRVVRGGSWDYDARSVRCAVRYGYLPFHRGGYGGFRVVAPGL